MSPQQVFSEEEWYAREERIRMAEEKQIQREAKREEALDKAWREMEDKLQAQSALIEKLGDELNSLIQTHHTDCKLADTDCSYKQALAAYEEWRKNAKS